MLRMTKAAAIALAFISLASAASAAQQGPYGIGRTATAAEIAGWNIDVGRDGRGTLATSNPVKTVGSYWPYAPILFDYIRRAMPQNAPGSLSNEDVYAVSAYILHLNGLLPADAVLDAKTMAAFKMPNRNMFIGDSRPDVKNPACESNC